MVFYQRMIQARLSRGLVHPRHLEGNAMTQPGTATWAVGDCITGSPRLVTQETINRYGELNGDNDIVHYDAEFARAHGFRAPIAHGMMVLGYLSETLREAWGMAWLTSGSVDVRWVAPVYPGDRITPGGRVIERVEDGDGARLAAEVWCDDQDGRRVLIGSASVRLSANVQDAANRGSSG